MLFDHLYCDEASLQDQITPSLALCENEPYSKRAATCLLGLLYL